MSEPRRLSITITDEGDGMFIATCGDKYTDPQERWNVIGVVMEWLVDGDLCGGETASGHKEAAQLIAKIFRKGGES